MPSPPSPVPFPRSLDFASPTWVPWSTVRSRRSVETTKTAFASNASRERRPCLLLSACAGRLSQSTTTRLSFLHRGTQGRVALCLLRCRSPVDPFVQSTHSFQMGGTARSSSSSVTAPQRRSDLELCEISPLGSFPPCPPSDSEKATTRPRPSICKLDQPVDLQLRTPSSVPWRSSQRATHHASSALVLVNAACSSDRTLFLADRRAG